MATDIVKYDAMQNKFVIYSSEDFICNTAPSSGPAANIHSILAAADISVGGGWAEQLLTGWGSEWEQTSSSRSSMSSCVRLHKCCCCPAQSPAVCSSQNAKKHIVRHKLVGISKKSKEAARKTWRNMLTWSVLIFVCNCNVSLIYFKFFCTLFWPSQNWLLSPTHQTTPEQTPSSSTSPKQTVIHLRWAGCSASTHLFKCLPFFLMSQYEIRGKAITQITWVIWERFPNICFVLMVNYSAKCCLNVSTLNVDVWL